MLTGINYWPQDKAMYWWRHFDLQELHEDFENLARWKFKIVRLFLNWEDFQPQPDKIARGPLDALLKVADTAWQNGIYIMPTFFCGHMSGINWVPEWLLDKNTTSKRFSVFSNNRLCDYGIRNFYNEDEVIAAQIMQIEKICSELQGHSALYAYDLGNEPSNLAIPPNRTAAQKWLKKITQSIKTISPQTPITIGMHAEDLEEDRNFWPQDAALYCDFLSMHGYPIYLTWVEDKLDPDLLPFLGLLTHWLGKKPVMIQEFGLPTYPVINPFPEVKVTDTKYPLFTEQAALRYYTQVLRRLQAYGFSGALAWCYGDYSPSLWNKPPLDNITHERYFGLFRHDGTPKQAVRAFSHPDSGNSPAEWQKNSFSINCDWLTDFNPEQFYLNPRYNLPFLFQKYKYYISQRSYL